jgi:hypothetical protein
MTKRVPPWHGQPDPYDPANYTAITPAEHDELIARARRQCALDWEIAGTLADGEVFGWPVEQRPACVNTWAGAQRDEQARAAKLPKPSKPRRGRKRGRRKGGR